MHIGVISAWDEESDQLLDLLQDRQVQQIGRRLFHTGWATGHQVTLASSLCGKVSAAAVASALITRFEVDLLIFTGVAGAVCSSLNIGDVVVAEELIQHDFNAHPIEPLYHIPFL